ncbi:MAG TPA: DUF2314 domain-containing protein [Chryseobacterium sp.]|uniref:DUF2314 domain-containing protein n=1 Tax=Chryseobacterium lactis TaxID=1241981 RepID=UPI00063D19FD|nr:DUF2314 domain-containing protein [Chryseobacterium lactis]HCN52126.1 DUF2314 domain-containing protein [Chryseobacterium sp.]
MNKNILSLLSVLVFAFCTGQSNNVKEKKTEQEKYLENAIYQISSRDKGMIAAIETARKTFYKFENALKSGNPNFKNFGLKKAFKSDQGDEFLWISPVLYSKELNKYAGTVNSPPVYTKEVKHDEVVEIEKNEISDWIYFDNGILQGGYTIRILRDRMTKEERKEFDEKSGYKFE